MTDLTLTPSARRFASFLEREFCAWMPSPSVALLAALVTGKGRPKRLLVSENAPAFISNIGLIIGATTVTVLPENIDEALNTVLRTEGLRADQVWAVATHREGKLSPTDWLTRCASSGIPTIDLCMGSLFALVRWSPFPASFTIVDLDAEEAFAGARLAALLTSDRGLAARVQELCLPDSGAQDYIFDALPRGLAHDETVLASLVDQVIALDGEKPPLTLRFPSAPERAAASRAEADSAALSDSRKRNDELQKTIDQWESRFDEAEVEAARDAEILSRARADLARMRTDSERALATLQAEKEGLAQKILRAERERDLAVLDAGRRDESERTVLSGLKGRVEEFEKAVAASADREARQAAAELASRKRLEARIARLEADAAGADKARTELQEQKAEAERALAAMRSEKDEVAGRLASLQGELSEARAELKKQGTQAGQALSSIRVEKEALAKRLGDLDAELSEALADAAKRAAEQRSSRDELSQRAARLESEVATLTAREASRQSERAGSEGLWSGRIALLESERDTLLNQLQALERDRGAALTDAERREEAMRLEMVDHRLRVEKLEAEAAALKGREARLAAELQASRASVSEQVSRLEAEAVAGRKASETLLAGRAADAQALATAEAEARTASERLVEARKDQEALRRALDEQKDRADGLGREAAALKEKSAKREGEWEALRAELSGRIARLEAGQALADQARAELLGQKEESERKRALLQAEKDAAAAGAGEAAQETAWESERASMSERIARLEASAAEAQEAHADAIKRMAADSERAVMSTRAEAEVAARKLLEVRKELALARTEAAGRGEAQRAVLEEQGRRAELTDEWERQRAELSERVARMEASAASAQQSLADLGALKAEGDLALEALRADREAMGARLAAQERDHALALADAAGREDAQRLVLEAEKGRAEKLAAEAAAHAEREANLTREWEVSRTEWTERLRRAEDAALVARNANAGLVARKTEAEQARTSLQAELEEQMRLAQQLKMEAAAVAAREAKKVEASEAARAELEMRIAKLEAREAIAEKARTELLNRKRDSDKALADAQAERAALLRKLATVENERDQAITAASHEAPAAPAPAPAGPTVTPDSRVVAPDRNTGGLAGLVGLWNTAVIRRPARNKDNDGPPPEPLAGDGLEVIVEEAPPTSSPSPVPQGDLRPRSDSAAPPTAVETDAGRPAPPSSPPAGKERTTGGLSALVNLWNTAATMRPFRRKESEARSVDPASATVLDIELIPDEPAASNHPASPARGAQAPPGPDRSAPGVRARPNPAPRRPEPKPAVVPDETEKLGGWLRGLAGRMRGKPK